MKTRDGRDVHVTIGGASTYELRACLVELAPDVKEVLVGHGGDLHALGSAGAINRRPKPDHRLAFHVLERDLDCCTSFQGFQVCHDAAHEVVMLAASGRA